MLIPPIRTWAYSSPTASCHSDFPSWRAGQTLRGARAPSGRGAAASARSARPGVVRAALLRLERTRPRAPPERPARRPRPRPADIASANMARKTRLAPPRRRPHRPPRSPPSPAPSRTTTRLTTHDAGHETRDSPPRPATRDSPTRLTTHDPRRETRSATRDPRRPAPHATRARHLAGVPLAPVDGMARPGCAGPPLGSRRRSASDTTVGWPSASGGITIPRRGPTLRARRGRRIAPPSRRATSCASSRDRSGCAASSRWSGTGTATSSSTSSRRGAPARPRTGSRSSSTAREAPRGRPSPPLRALRARARRA